LAQILRSVSWPLQRNWAVKKAETLGVMDAQSLMDELDPSLSFSENKTLFFNALRRRGITLEHEVLEEAEQEEQYQSYLIGEMERRGLRILTPEMEKALAQTYQQTREILALQSEIDRLKGSLQDMRSRLPAQELEYREKLEELKRKEGDLEAWQKQLTAWQFNGKTQVRFLYAMPKFLGFDMKPYGPYAKGDIAELPRENAEALLKRGLAEASNSSEKNNDLVRFKVNEEKKRPVKVVSMVKDIPDTRIVRKKVPEKIEPKLKEVPSEEAKPIEEAWIVILAVLGGGLFFLVTGKSWFSYALSAFAFIVSGLGAFILLRRRGTKLA